MSAFDPKRGEAAVTLSPLSTGWFQQLRWVGFSGSGAVMRRRDFVKGLVGTTASWPLRAHAQQAAIPVVGFLHSGIEEQATQLMGFKKGLKESGFEDGRDVSVQYRFAEGHYDRLPHWPPNL